MNINSKSMIAGLPALEARDIASKLINFTDGFSVKCYADRFNISEQLAVKQIEVFEDEGYFERIFHKKHQLRWNRTVKACALAMASAAPKVKRTTADRHYHAFMDRVKEINQSDEYLYKVTKVALFGSYLTNAEAVSDIDLFVWLEVKSKFSLNFDEIVEQRMAKQTQGRSFKSYLERNCWPEINVRRYLKNGSRVISIQGHNWGYEQVDSKIVFET